MNPKDLMHSSFNPVVKDSKARADGSISERVWLENFLDIKNIQSCVSLQTVEDLKEVLTLIFSFHKI